jgi:Ca-activated chloride channel family protein
MNRIDRCRWLIVLVLAGLAAACTAPRPPEALTVPKPPPAAVAPVAPTEQRVAPTSPPAVAISSPSAPAAQSYNPPAMRLPPPGAANTARYAQFADNPWQQVREQPVSTFSADVDTGSYANVRRFINRGGLPVKYAVRVEELVNYFAYDYPRPAAADRHPFSVQANLVASPWKQGRWLLRIGIKGKDVAKTTLPPANLVFLVDVSGSMGPADRLPLVKSSLKLLAGQLRAVDRVSIVTYASGTKLALPATPGDQRERIRAAIDAAETTPVVINSGVSLVIISGDHRPGR